MRYEEEKIIAQVRQIVEADRKSLESNIFLVDDIRRKVDFVSSEIFKIKKRLEILKYYEYVLVAIGLLIGVLYGFLISYLGGII